MHTKKDNQSNVKSTKGYLFEIKDNEKKVLGYFFGTIHQLNKEDISRLDDKVLACFDSSSHLALEITYPENLDDHSIEYIGDNARGIDDFLYYRAKSQGKAIISLETDGSKAAAKNAAQKKYQISYSKEEKFENLLGYTFGLVFKHYHELNSLLSSGSLEGVLDKVVDKIYRILPMIELLLKHEKQLRKSSFQVIQRVPDLFVMLDSITQCLEALEIISDSAVFKEQLLSKISEYDKNDIQMLQDVQNVYINGDPKPAQQNYIPRSSLDGEVRKEQELLQMEAASLRDKDMVEMIDKDLKETQLNTKHCGFYAVGADHLVGNYQPNLITRLREKGWDIAPINLSKADEKIARPKQAFFESLNKEEIQYKSENSIPVKQYLP